MVMAEYFIRDRLQELWQQINHLHLTYLDTEDSPQKIEQRNKLEACIREYLSIAPHNRKFYCPETSEVLHRSASSKKDFSGYRAALAWNAVSMYAGNLLSQPWRKEYRQIKMYCGFYKHQIDANLVGAEALFEAMGYKHAGDGILVLEGPVCPDRVTNVSLDSIVAFVECQILKTIWEEVSSNNFKVSWLDVLQFRESHLCSAEQSIRLLTFKYNERRYLEQQHHRAYSSSQGDANMLRYSAPAPSTATTFPPPLPPAPPHHQHVPPPLPCAAHCMYAHPYYNYSTYAPPPHYPRYTPYPLPNHCAATKPCNGYCYPNGCVPQPTYMCPVPTGQLIELDTTQNGMYDTTDSVAKRQQDQLESHKQLAKSTNLDSLTLSKSKEDGAGTFESWDFVYKNLESQGYNKDLGERPDVLQSEKRRHTLRDGKKTKPSVELEDEFNNLNLNAQSQSEPHNLKINEALKRFNKDEIAPRKPKIDDVTRVAQSSSYDNISSQDSFANHNSKPAVKSVSNGVAKTTKTLPRERPVVVSPEKSSHLTTLDSRKLRKQDVDKLRPKDLKTKDKNDLDGWNCYACTYFNSTTVDICIICGKSKKNVEIKMAVGGSQCPQCTLVNPKHLLNCEACGTNLQNSPTYI